MNEVKASPPADEARASEGFDGLVFGYRFSDKGSAELLEGPALREALARARG